jgi:hypothetical protein
MESHGVKVERVQQIQPSLEDVFVALTTRESKAERAA